MHDLRTSTHQARATYQKTYAPACLTSDIHLPNDSPTRQNWMHKPSKSTQLQKATHSHSIPYIHIKSILSHHNHDFLSCQLTLSRGDVNLSNRAIPSRYILIIPSFPTKPKTVNRTSLIPKRNSSPIRKQHNGRYEV